jgi:hypothetical protein
MSYTFYNILSSDSIGDSLTYVNANYSNLNNWVLDVQNDYNSFLSPLVELYKNNYDQFLGFVNFAQQYQNDITNFITTVDSNSSIWLQPIFTFYPILLEFPFKTNNLNDIVNWLNVYYPIVDNNGNKNFIQNQQIIIYCYTFIFNQQLNIEEIKTITTTCTTDNPKICVSCSETIPPASVVCSQGTFYCGLTWSCLTCATSDCNFLNPPYYDIKKLPSKSVQAKSSIQGVINASYNDRREIDDITMISFKVIDCNWTFDKFITATSSS